MDVEIKKLTNKDIADFSELIRVFEHVFGWHNFSIPNRLHLQKILDNRYFFVFVAKTDDKLVGGLTAYVLDRYDSEKPSAYIYDLAVLTDFQRKGVGKKLITTLNEYCKNYGFNDIFVQAETDDIQAVNFYRTTEISSELQATQFSYSFDKNPDNNEN